MSWVPDGVVPTGADVVDARLSDDEVAALWSASGARWLTSPSVAVPGLLVRRVVGLVDALDRRGAGTAHLVGARGLGFLAERAALMGLPPSSRTSCGGATRLMRATDSWLAVSLARPDDVAALPALFDGDIEVSTDLGAPGTVGDGVWAAVESSVSDRSGADVVERAGLLGIPCCVVGGVSDARPVLVEQLGQASPRPLDGVVVVNLAALWAGPLCADLLARLGARVVKVESTSRPDGGRLARRFFSALHGRSESVALDLTGESGRLTLRRLLGRADVVIEGSRPRALEQMGIIAAQVVEHGPQVWLSITAHGRRPGPAGLVGFGDDAAAAGGLVGWVDGEPRFLADAVADPLTGLSAARLVVDLLDAGGRWLADVALSRVASSAVGELVELDARAAERPRPRRDPGGPMPLGRDTTSVLESLGVA